MLEKYNVEFADIYQAYCDCRKKKKNKDGSKKFEPWALYSLKNLQSDLENNNYKLSTSQCFIIHRPTIREVFCANFRDRIIQHFIYNELNPIIDKMFIYDAANCRVGKGTDFAIKRVQRFIRRETNNYKDECYFLKLDVSGFFMKINRELLCNKVLEVVENKYSGKYSDLLSNIIPILIKTDITKDTFRLCSIKEWENLPKRKTLFGNSNGLPVGNLCSQLFANLYFNDIDHVIKKYTKNYSRYVDDIICVSHSLEELIFIKKLIISELKKLNMNINYNKTKINNISNKIHYLGVIINKYYTILGKYRINRLYESINTFKNVEDMYKKSGSRRGMLKNYKGKNILYRWYNKLPENIKFKININNNLKLIYKDKDTNKKLHILY